MGKQPLEDKGWVLEAPYNENKMIQNENETC